MILTSLPYFSTIKDYNYFKNVTLKFNFICNLDSNNKPDYLKSYYNLYAITKDSNKYKNRNKNIDLDLDMGIDQAKENQIISGIYFHTFSDKILSSYGNYSVFTFYSTFILIAGNYIRTFFSSGSERIILTDMPEPQSLITLCEGIKISRYRYDFERY
jgi:hypothetical protein